MCVPLVVQHGIQLPVGSSSLGGLRLVMSIQLGPLRVGSFGTEVSYGHILGPLRVGTVLGPEISY